MLRRIEASLAYNFPQKIKSPLVRFFGRAALCPVLFDSLVQNIVLRNQRRESAAGLHIGRSIAFPGEQSVLASAAAAGQRASLVMAGVVLMLVAAAILEGFARQLIDNSFGRLAVGSFMLVFWLVYFFVFRRSLDRSDGG